MTTRSLGAEPPATDPAPSLAEREPGLFLAAERARAPAALLLAAAVAPMLTIAAELGKPRPRTMLRYWTLDFAPLPPPAHQEPPPATLRNAERELRRTGIELARHLALRWPAQARPKLIGIVTDGVGVAVSGTHPSALSRDWLSDHLSGRARVSTLLPFGPRTRIALQAPLVPVILQ